MTRSNDGEWELVGDGDPGCFNLGRGADQGESTKVHQGKEECWDVDCGEQTQESQSLQYQLRSH